jgi:hypothetical protein
MGHQPSHSTNTTAHSGTDTESPDRSLDDTGPDDLFAKRYFATPFAKRPALAPLYAALTLGITSLDHVTNRKLRWGGRVRRIDWSKLPRKFPTSHMARRGLTHLAAEEGHTPNVLLRRGAAWRFAELGCCR